MGRNFRSVIITTASVFAGIAASSSAFANQVTSDQVKGDEAASCGQACAYEKANHNITLQARYGLRKIEMLKKLVIEGKDGEVLSNLGEFCFASEKARGCFDRYQRFQVAVLKKARLSTGHNEAMMSNLTGSDSKPSFAVENQQGLVPEVPTLEEISVQFQKSSRLQRMSRDEFKDWAEYQASAPTRGDFIRFKNIPRDPGNPDAGELTKVDTDAAGKPLVDEDAYQAALSLWQSKSAPGSHDLKTDVASIKKEQNGRRGSLFVAGPLNSETKASQQEYNLARMEIIVGTQKVLGSKTLNQPGEVSFAVTGSEKIDLEAAKNKTVHVRYSMDLMQKHIDEASKSID